MVRLGTGRLVPIPFGGVMAGEFRELAEDVCLNIGSPCIDSGLGAKEIHSTIERLMEAVAKATREHVFGHLGDNSHNLQPKCLADIARRVKDFTKGEKVDKAKS